MQRVISTHLQTSQFMSLHIPSHLRLSVLTLRTPTRAMASHSTPTTPIYLEGTTLEGGGQLLRIALGLSSLTKKPINITNIRGKRSGGGGLKAQHLTSAQWLGQACNARLNGAELKGKEMTFTPQQDGAAFQPENRGNEFRITQTTPGSINLILQAILPYLLFSGTSAPIRVHITGGTNVFNSPSYDYIKEVLIPTLTLIGIPPIASRIHSRGWSQGSTSLGSVTYTITPLRTALPAFNLTQRGTITHVKAIVIAPRNTQQHFRDELDAMFDKRAHLFFGLDNISGEVDIAFEASHHDKRYYILLIATSTSGIKIARDWLYDHAIRPGKTEKIPPTMVKKVSDGLLKELAHGGCVDEYMRDQLVVFQALAQGRSEVLGGRKVRGDGHEGDLVEPSLHARTAMWVAEKMLGVECDAEGACVGVGFEPCGRGDGDEVDGLAGELETLNVEES
ncbi:RNA 3'-terminal phosphate cyclase [Ophiobolus disseminans]|uniref:RNA 3'-terminal phosphate cyclase n=1 Tax=Ophiobolus disseminans TaxID=1469910 RepID=A0A6A6ZQP6_9PLEO|nr:RNA 3'-terminal phosphate cyclase [Ophiobolus disseminans]